MNRPTPRDIQMVSHAFCEHVLGWKPRIVPRTTVVDPEDPSKKPEGGGLQAQKDYSQMRDRDGRWHTQLSEYVLDLDRVLGGIALSGEEPPSVTIDVGGDLGGAFFVVVNSVSITAPDASMAGYVVAYLVTAVEAANQGRAIACPEKMCDHLAPLRGVRCVQCGTVVE